MAEPTWESESYHPVPDFEALFDQGADMEPVSMERLQFLRTVLALAEEWQELESTAKAALGLAKEMRLHGDNIETERLANLAAQQARQCGRADLESEAFSLLAEESLSQKDGVRAEDLFRQAVDCLKRAGEVESIWRLEERRAKILADIGRHEEALRLLQEMPEQARCGRAGLLEARMLWSLDRQDESLLRLDDLITDLKYRGESRWNLGCEFMLRDLLRILGEMEEFQRQRALIEWRISNLRLNSPTNVGASATLSLKMAKNHWATGEAECAARWLMHSIPLLEESCREDLFDALAFAWEANLPVPGRSNPLLLAIAAIGPCETEKSLSVLGASLSCGKGDPALEVLREARKRFRRNDDLPGEAKTWILQARLEIDREREVREDEQSTVRLKRALRSLSKAIPLARRKADLYLVFEGLSLRQQIQRRTGQVIAAHRAATQAERLAQKLGETDLIICATIQLANTCLAKNDREQTMILLQRARLLSDSLEPSFDQFHWKHHCDALERELARQSRKRAEDRH